MTRRCRPPGRAWWWTRLRPSISSTSSGSEHTAFSPTLCRPTSTSGRLSRGLIRAGVYMGPLNMCLAAYGGGTLGRNPFDVVNFLQRIPQNAVATIWSSMRGNHTLQALGIILGLHVRVGNEDNIWGANRERSTSLQQVKGAVNVCKMFGRRLATAAEARKIMKVGVWYNSVDETLQGSRDVAESRGLQCWPPTLGDGRKAEDRGGRKRLASYCRLLGASRGGGGCGSSRKTILNRLGRETLQDGPAPSETEPPQANPPRAWLTIRRDYRQHSSCSGLWRG